VKFQTKEEEMRKIQRIFGIFLCTTMLFTLCGMEIFAKGPLDGQTIDGSLLTSNAEAFDTKPLIPENPFESEISPYGTYLSNGTAGITDHENGVIYVSGETSCYRTCDSVQVNLYLERLANGSWYTVSMHPHTSYNTYFASHGLYLSVAKGYYYRVRGGHVAKKGITTETVTTCSNGIFID
jgi:hypothetical protein